MTDQSAPAGTRPSTLARPEQAELTEGAAVIVIQPRSAAVRGQSSLRSEIPAVITKVNRVWLTVESAPEIRPARTWRIRRDTRTEGTRDFPQYDARIVTADELTYERAITDARNYLNRQGITARFDSPWYGRDVELADLLRTADPDLPKEPE